MAFGALLLGAAGLSQFAAGDAEAEALEQAARFQQNRIAFNRKLSAINAEDAIARGEEQVVDFKKEAARLKGSQRAALAAQGIQVDAGSAAAVQYETEKQIDTDIQRIRNNAWREAWGFKVEQVNLESEARLSQLQGEAQAQAARAGGAAQGLSTIFSAFV